MTLAPRTNRHYYAMSDTLTGDNPKEYTAGFANTKTAIAFRSRKERSAWLCETKLTTAKAITRAEAERLTKRENGDYYGSRSERCKPVRIYGTGEGYEAQYILIAESAN